jgi:hypothetical protein
MKPGAPPRNLRASYPVIATGLLAYRAGRVGPGCWALVFGGGAAFVAAVHFGPAAVEPPQLILDPFQPPVLGWLARPLPHGAHDGR